MRFNRNPARILLGFSFLMAVASRPAAAIELQSGTLEAWDDYVRTADRNMQARLASGRPFLWSDEAPGRAVRLQRGEVLVSPVVGRGTRSVPNGLIHDWVGAVFIPHATLAQLFAVVHDYDRYKEIYTPAVADSKVIACTDTDQEFSMVWQRRILFVNAAVEGRYQAHDFTVGPHRGYNIARTRQIQEIEEFGKSGERLLPPGQGNGFLWRLHSIARYQERDGGVYLELEAIALTRDIPASLRWMVNPVVNRLSVNSLASTLSQTRDAVRALAGRPELLTSCAARTIHASVPKNGTDE